MLESGSEVNFELPVEVWLGLGERGRGSRNTSQIFRKDHTCMRKLGPSSKLLDRESHVSTRLQTQVERGLMPSYAGFSVLHFPRGGATWGFPSLYRFLNLPQRLVVRSAAVCGSSRGRQKYSSLCAKSHMAAGGPVKSLRPGLAEQ